MILGEGIRAGRRRVANVHAHRRARGGSHLNRRVARDEVMADLVAGRKRKQQDAVDVAADTVLLDGIVAARPDEADTEVVRGTEGRSDDNRAVPVEVVPADVVPVAVDDAVSTARSTTGCAAVAPV